MRQAAVLLGVLAGCATAPARPEAPPPELPRSSIAAVLEHTGELELTAEQVERLDALDERLEAATANLRAEAGMKKRAADPAAPLTSRGERGAGMGTPGMGGGRRGGGGMRPARSTEDDASRSETFRRKMDDADTAAYLEAEQVLTEEQKPKARAIASRFREQLFDRRMRLQQEGN